MEAEDASLRGRWIWPVAHGRIWLWWACGRQGMRMDCCVQPLVVSKPPLAESSPLVCFSFAFTGGVFTLPSAQEHPRAVTAPASTSSFAAAALLPEFRRAWRG